MPFAVGGTKSVALAEVGGSPAARMKSFDRPAVAGLSSAEIHGLTCDELVRVVQTAPPPTVPPEMLEHLEFQSREVLERLAFLARECCRNQGYAQPVRPR